MKLILKLKNLLIFLFIYIIFFNPILYSPGLQNVENHHSINYFSHKIDESYILEVLDQLKIVLSKDSPDLYQGFIGIYSSKEVFEDLF